MDVYEITASFRVYLDNPFDLLDTLSKTGPCSVYALAKTAERNYSNVHTDINRLEELGLIERTEEGQISVPFEAVEIVMPLAKAA